ncbi:ankyrin and armadillo repeat-containing protein-like [Octopus sinensis]|uniref:Ankyrin and armadillo repeat-containing protein-like n=1 Tax=Octopus sinensis TaxID=2607531 RepID=A0A7E6EL78_9MOLL|nr:ankyrin and armadillo repeat-containing protein-like [Octopus sinensis]
MNSPLSHRIEAPPFVDTEINFEGSDLFLRELDKVLEICPLLFQIGEVTIMTKILHIKIRLHILVPANKFDNILLEEFHQIIKDLTVGIYCFSQVPNLTLETNADMSSECNISPVYKKTRVAEIVTEVDYMVKALWHGSFFPKEKRLKFSDTWRKKLDVDENGQIQTKRDIFSEFEAWDYADSNGWLPIHYASAFNHPSIIRVIKKRSNMQLNCFVSLFQSPIHVAAKYGALDSIKYLLDSGVDFLTCDSNQATITRLAALSLHPSVLKYLIEKNLKGISVWEELGECLINLRILLEMDEGRDDEEDCLISSIVNKISNKIEICKELTHTTFMNYFVLLLYFDNDKIILTVTETLANVLQKFLNLSVKQEAATCLEALRGNVVLQKKKVAEALGVSRITELLLSVERLKIFGLVRFIAKCISVLMENLSSKNSNHVIVAARRISSLLNSDCGIGSAFVTAGLVETSVKLLKNTNHDVAEALATLIGYLTFNTTAFRMLLTAVRCIPKIYFDLIQNINKDAKINSTFVETFQDNLISGLPIYRFKLFYISKETKK